MDKACNILESAWVWDPWKSTILLGAILGERFWELLLLNHALVCACLPECLFLAMCLLRLWELFESYRAEGERGKSSVKISSSTGSNYLMIFFIRSKPGWLVNQQHMIDRHLSSFCPAACPAGVCAGLLGSLVKDESFFSAEESSLGKGLFGSGKPMGPYCAQGTCSTV